jgi:hypothetical protein
MDILSEKGRCRRRRDLFIRNNINDLEKDGIPSATGVGKGTRASFMNRTSSSPSASASSYDNVNLKLFTALAMRTRNRNERASMV